MQDQLKSSVASRKTSIHLQTKTPHMQKTKQNKTKKRLIELPSKISPKQLQCIQFSMQIIAN